jgi:hypothetical protein
MSQLTWKRRHWAVTAPAVVDIAYSTAWIVALAIWPSSLSVNASRPQVMTAYAGHEGRGDRAVRAGAGVAAAALAAVVIALD